MTGVVLAKPSYLVFIMTDSPNGHKLAYAMDGTFFTLKAEFFNSFSAIHLKFPQFRPYVILGYCH